jgi:hypothetical protein
MPTGKWRGAGAAAAFGAKKPTSRCRRRAFFLSEYLPYSVREKIGGRLQQKFKTLANEGLHDAALEWPPVCFVLRQHFPASKVALAPTSTRSVRLTMKFLIKSASLLSLACLAFTVATTRATTIATNTAGTAPLGSPQYVGQSFTVAGAGSFNNISFNFFSDPAATIPYALGTGFLLSTAYGGAPQDLTSGTAGYLGHAAAAGGFYSFDSGVTLVAGTQYFFYSDALFSGTSIYGNGDTYAGGQFSRSLGAAANFNPLPGLDADFHVTGDVVGAPDGGSTALMLALGVIGLFIGRRSLRRR